MLNIYLNIIDREKMSKHLQGNPSWLLLFRLRLAGTRMVITSEKAAKARTKYEALYFERYGLPSIKQSFDVSYYSDLNIERRG